MSGRSVAAFGFRLRGDVAQDRFTVLGQPDWPVLSVRVADDPVTVPGALTHPLPRGQVSYDPKSGDAVIATSDHESLEDLVHPAMMVTAFLAARARDDETFHASACSCDGEGWLLLGDHEAGKSTLLAMLSTLGCDPLTDDMTVVRDGVVCAGPRCLDLRPPSAEQLGIGEPVRQDTRRRVSLEPVAAEHRLRGFIHLRWGAELELRELSGGERLRRLIAAVGHLPRRDHARLLDFAALAHFELTRPGDWSSARRSAEVACDLMRHPPVP